MNTPVNTFRQIPRPWLSAIVVLATAIRLLVWTNDPFSDEPKDDSAQYHNLAHSLVEGGVLSTNKKEPFIPSARRVPGYPLLLASVYAVTGPDVHAVKLLQCLMFAPIICILTFLITRRATDSDPFALVTAATIAIAPPLITMSNHLMTESLFTLLLLMAIYSAYLWVDERRSGAAALCGLCWGALTLVKPEAFLLPFAFLAAGLILTVDRRTFAKQGLLAVAMAGVVVTPWVYRNYRVMGKASLQVSRPDELGIWGGKGFFGLYRRRAENGFTYWPKRYKYIYGDDWRLAEDKFQAAMLGDVQDPAQSDMEFWLRRPGLVVKYTGIRLVGLLKPISWSQTFGLNKDFGEYRQEGDWGRLGVKAALLITDGLMIGLGLAGLLLSLHPRHKRLWIISSTVCYFLAVYGLLHGISRYRVPLVPLFLLLGVWFACLALTRVRQSIGGVETKQSLNG